MKNWSKPGEDVIGDIESAAKAVGPRGCAPQPLVATRKYGVLAEYQIESAKFLTDIERERFVRALREARKQGVLLVDEDGMII
jgi:hypothetical protein